MNNPIELRYRIQPLAELLANQPEHVTDALAPDVLTREERLDGIRQELPGPRLAFVRPLGVPIAPDADLIAALDGFERKEAARKRNLLVAAIVLLAACAIPLWIFWRAN